MQIYANNAASTLAADITSGATSLSVSSGQGARFPSPSAHDYFLVTITEPSSESVWEIVKVTARSSDSFTIVRAQDGTSPAAWTAGAKVELRLSAEPLTRFDTTLLLLQLYYPQFYV